MKTLATRKIVRRLDDGCQVVFEPKRRKVMILSPDGNPWSVISARVGYTVDEFTKYANRVSEMLKSKVFPWSKPQCHA